MCEKIIYVSLRTHRRDKHTNQSYGEKEITTVRFTLYEKKETIGFIYLNHIKHVQDILEKYLD
jgi:hypothetical protein